MLLLVPLLVHHTELHLLGLTQQAGCFLMKLFPNPLDAFAVETSRKEGSDWLYSLFIDFFFQPDLSKAHSQQEQKSCNIINEPLLKTLQCHLLDTSIFYMFFNVQHCTKCFFF